MKFKSFLLCSIVAFFSISFTACEDSLSTLGSNILPDTDSIDFGVDSVYLTARTISLEDSVYAKTRYGLIGRYTDDIFGSIKADYLCEFYYPEGQVFNGEDYGISIDSAAFIVAMSKYTGDTIAPMGLSVYELNNKLTEDSYYTNIDPAKYCDMSKPLANSAFTISSSPYAYISSSTIAKTIRADLGKDFGKRFYQAYKDGQLSNTQKFKEFFPGVYVTTSFGKGVLVNVESTMIDIYYSYLVPKGNYDGTADSTYVDYFTISNTSEVIQLNRIQNKIPANLLDNNINQANGVSYIMSPAGLCTELTLPLDKIVANLIDNNGNIDEKKIINYAKLSLSGYTEKENVKVNGIPRVDNILLIEKDSVDAFFKKKYLPGYLGFSAYTTISNNAFTFNNIAQIITHYVKKYNEDKTLKNPVMLVLPVSFVYTSGSSSGGSIIGVYNQMAPQASIIRIDKENLKLKYSYSKY